MTSTTLRELVGRFERIRVLVVGDPILDEYVTGDCTRLSPEAPIPVLRVRAIRAVPGGAANTAANIAALGGTALLAGVVGRDEAGRRLRQLVSEHGVECLLVDDDRPSSRKVRALGGQQQLLRLDYEDDGRVAAAAAGATLDLIAERLPDVDIVVVSDYAKGLIDPAFSRRLLALARAAGRPVIVDPRPQNAAAYAGFDYLTPNWREAQALLGEPERAPDEQAVTDIGRRVAERFDANVLLTLGAGGLRFFGRDGLQLLDEPARAREVFDVSGAGDTVVATFALALASGAGLQDALRLANLAAGIVVAKLGTATVSRRELLDAPNGGGRLADAAALAMAVRSAREAGRRIALVTGRFLAFDVETLERLQAVRDQADVLIVALQDDEPDTAGRARMLLALRDVDLVHISTDPAALVGEVAPDLHVELGASEAAGRARS